MVDFRSMSLTIKDVVKNMNEASLLWKWSEKILKNRVELYWEYLVYCGAANPFFLVTTEDVESGEDFFVLKDEQGEFLDGRIPGGKSYQDGSSEECVISLLKYAKYYAESRY